MKITQSKFIKPLKIIKLLSAGLAIFLTIFLASFQIAYRHQIYPGITVANIPLGNQAPDKAIKTLKNSIKKSPAQKLTLFNDEQKWDLVLTDIFFLYDLHQTINKAYNIGRGGTSLENLKTKALAWSKGIDLTFEYQLNQDLLQDRVASYSAQLFVPHIEPTISLVNQEIVINPGQAGQELDQNKLIMTIKHRLATRNFQPLELPINRSAWKLSESQIQNTRQRAEKLIEKKILLTFENQQWEITNENLLNFLAFDEGLNQEKIASQTAVLATSINRLPQNAIFQFQNKRVTEFHPAEKGQELDQEKTKQLIASALEETDLMATGSSEIIINLPVGQTDPEITIDQINNLGIKELIGTGRSYFNGSSLSRIHNLTLAASKLNGILIPPEAIFSFNDTLGEVSPETGYKSAFVIKEGRTILGDGGGVCQTSTTLFRTILDTGFPIIERHPHSYRVSYYEQGGFGPGIDATIWMPGTDLKFKNDSPAYVLIQTKIDNQSQSLVFEFYGTHDGRQTFLSQPKYWNQTPPPPDLYQDDPSLPIGTLKQIERSIPGAKVSVDWKVTRNNITLQEKSFYSHYQPWQAVYLRGTAQP
ncbi:VanW family protein [Patescibacteria group bacterium]